MQTILQSNEPQAWLLSLLVIATAIAGIATAVCAIAVGIERLRPVDHSRLSAGGHRGMPTSLPVGASTALAAITELRPDPRNVVVTHRDPTGEVRLQPLVGLGRDVPRTA